MEKFKSVDVEESKTRIKTLIESSGNGKVSLSDLLLSSADILKIMEDDYGAHYDFENIDSNGWEMDFWIPVQINDEKYTVEGGGVYRNLSLIKGE